MSRNYRYRLLMACLTLEFALVAPYALLEKLAAAERQLLFYPTGELLSGAAPTRLRIEPATETPTIASVVYSPDGKLLASAGYDKLIRLWDVSTGKEVRRLAGHRDWVSCVKFSPDEKTLASGSRDWSVRLWDVAAGQEVRRFQDPGGGVLAVDISPDGKLLLAGGQDQTVYLWETASGFQIFRSHAQVDWVTAVTFSPDGKLLACASWDGTVRLRKAGQLEETQRLGKGHGRFLATAFVPGGFLATVSQNKGVSLWETATGKEVRVFGDEPHRAMSLAVSPDGKMLASGSKDGTIRLWETASGHELRPVGQGPHRICCLAFSPDGKSLASGNSNGSLMIWNIAEQAVGEPRSVALKPPDLERLWADLADADAAKANRAVWLLTKAPAQSVLFVRERLRAVAIDEPGVQRLAADLDSTTFSVRQKANEELEKLGKFAEPTLRQVLQGKPSLEVRQRVQRLLAQVEGEPWVPYPDAVRAGRALSVLTTVATQEARQVLQTLAQGASASWLTMQAKSGIARMNAPDKK